MTGFSDTAEVTGIDLGSVAAALGDADAREAKLVAAIGELDETGLLDTAGRKSTAAWLAEQGMHRLDAYELVRLARKMRKLPSVLAAWHDRRLTRGQVRTIAANVAARHVGLFNDHAEELLEALRGLHVDDTEIAMRRWRERADALDDPKERAQRPSEAYLSQTLENRGDLKASLDAAGYSIVDAAMRVAESGDKSIPAPQRRAEALVHIFSQYLGTQDDKNPRRHKPQIQIVVQAETLGTDYLTGFVPATGMTLSKEVTERLLCDCEMHRVVMAEGAVLDYGRTVKNPPPNLAAAVIARDQHCRWPGCNAPPNKCHIHHVGGFAPPGTAQTRIEDLVLQCDHDHTIVHRPGWSSKLDPNGDYHVTSPWGETWTTHAPGRIQQDIPMPGPPPESSPVEDHRDLFESTFWIVQRAQRLKAEREAEPIGHAIASLITSPARNVLLDADYRPWHPPFEDRKTARGPDYPGAPRYRMRN